MNKEDYNKYYIQGSDHYLIPKDVFKELFNEMSNWKEEAKKLKKQLEDISEELELVRCDLHNRTSERDGYERELNECLSQQKEFIKYLEDNWKQTQDIWYIKILQKYKKIIGVPIVGLDVLE